jgi:hypothetical protein
MAAATLGPEKSLSKARHGGDDHALTEHDGDARVASLLFGGLPPWR